MSSTSLKGNREFLLLWSGQALSGLGSQISQVAYPLLVLALTGSAAQAGIVGFVRQLPIAVLALPAGALADRVDRKRLMIGCDALRGVALASIPAVLLATGIAPFGLIAAVAFLDGAGFVLRYVTERGALRRLVAPEHLGEAVARNEARVFGAMLAGPPLGGLLYGIGRAVPFLADAVSYVASTVSLALIRSDLQEPRSGQGPGTPWDGLRWLWRRPFLRLCALLFAASNPLFTGLYLLVVILARRHGASAGLVGVMLGIAAAGGLIGALLAPALQRRVSPRFALVGESWAMAVAIPLLLLTHAALLLGVILAAAELLTPVTNSFVVGFRVALAPDHLQGRVQAASTMLSFSAGWLGPLAVGLLVQGTGQTATVLALAGWALLLALLATASPAFRHPPAIDASALAP